MKRSLECAVKILKSNPGIFDEVEKMVRWEYPNAVGRGLIWFFNNTFKRAVPAPEGVQATTPFQDV